MADDLTSKSATALLQLIKTRTAASVEIVEAHLRRIEQRNPALNAIVTIAPDVLDRARELDAELVHGKVRGPLHGLPITVKDTIDTANIRTTRGSRLFVDNEPTRDAAVVERLRAAGAIVLGKTNVPEMAIPYETDNLVFGRTNNPHDVSRTPGGSSGGEAAAIAANSSPAGIGSDLSGSIRVPAHFCGIAGLKTTPGLVPMQGHLPPAVSTLSFGAVIGPMARHVDDLALLFAVMADKPAAESREQERDLTGIRVACFADDGVTQVEDDIARALERAERIFENAGLELIKERPPSMADGSRLWIELFSEAAKRQIRELYHGHEDKAGPDVSTVLQTDREDSFEERVVFAEMLAAAVVERERLRERLLRWMRNTPLVLAPVSATVAFAHGAPRVEVKGRSISIFRSCAYSHAANVFGLPAAVVPLTRTTAGLPIGVQVIGRPAEDWRVLAAAAILEREAEFE